MSDEQTLAGLIADRKGTRSYDKLSKDCGGTPTAKRLHQLANVAPKNFPDPDTIRGLAVGLGVTVTDIVMASARSLALPVYTGDDPNALSIGGAGALPDSAKETLATVAREFIKLTSQLTDGVKNEDTGTQGTPSGTTSDGKAGTRGAPMMAFAALRNAHAGLSMTEAHLWRAIVDSHAREVAPTGSEDRPLTTHEYISLSALVSALVYADWIAAVSRGENFPLPEELRDAFVNPTQLIDASHVSDVDIEVELSPTSDAPGPLRRIDHPYRLRRDSQDEFDLARRTVKGGSKEKQRRRTEVAPEDHSQDEGPEFGA